MALKHFFKGKSGAKFWVNIALMILLIIAIPVLTFYMLGAFTHHGEKIEVPNVVGKSFHDAERMLGDGDLVAMVIDSIYEKNAPKGSVLEQSPKPGYEVKGGRVVYLTVNLSGEPMADLPDVVGQGSLRQAVAMLQSAHFKLTAHKYVMGHPKDLVIGVKQGGRDVHAGQSLPRERPLTLIVGGGEFEMDDEGVEDSLDAGLDMEGMDDTGAEESGEDFDIEL